MNLYKSIVYTFKHPIQPYSFKIIVSFSVKVLNHIIASYHILVPLIQEIRNAFILWNIILTCNFCTFKDSQIRLGHFGISTQSIHVFHLLSLKWWANCWFFIISLNEFSWNLINKCFEWLGIAIISIFVFQWIFLEVL